jgi:hypothetical protein
MSECDEWRGSPCSEMVGNLLLYTSCYKSEGVTESGSRCL